MGQLNNLILPRAFGDRLRRSSTSTSSPERSGGTSSSPCSRRSTGFAIGVSIGIALAIVAGLNPTFRRYIAPYVVLVQVTPLIAVAPLMIAWLGFGWSSKIGIAALVCFFAPVREHADRAS